MLNITAHVVIGKAELSNQILHKLHYLPHIIFFVQFRKLKAYDVYSCRIEPLVCKEYISKRPVIVPYHKGGRRLYIGFQVTCLKICSSLCIFLFTPQDYNYVSLMSCYYLVQEFSENLASQSQAIKDHLSYLTVSSFYLHLRIFLF